MADNERGERVEVKKKTFKVEITLFQYEVSVQLLAFVCMNHYFHRLLISSQHMYIRRLFTN